MNKPVHGVAGKITPQPARADVPFGVQPPLVAGCGSTEEPPCKQARWTVQYAAGQYVAVSAGVSSRGPYIPEDIATWLCHVQLDGYQIHEWAEIRKGVGSW